MYVKDAVRALTGLHDADAAKLTTRVYNVSGIRNANDQAPQASEIAAAVRDALGANTPAISFDNPDDTLTKIVTSFGILNDQQAQQDWGWQPEYKDLAKAVTDFIDQVKKYPNRIKRLELY
jgi:nucleoside-diphosphate-sugar epimerase